MQRGYQKGIVEANRNALKSEAGAQLARLQLKKDEHIRLCAMRCDKYNDYVKVVPCPARPPRRRPEGLRRGVRDQIRVRLHVYKVKARTCPTSAATTPRWPWPASWPSCGLWWPVPCRGTRRRRFRIRPARRTQPRLMRSCGRGMSLNGLLPLIVTL